MPPRPSLHHLSFRFRQLTLNSSTPTALFYARLYYSLCHSEVDHESLHILALCLLESEQPYSALHLVRDTADSEGEVASGRPLRQGCYGCSVIVARCCMKLSRFSEGKAVLERALRRGLPTNLPTLNSANSSANASLLLASLSHKGKAPAVAVEQYTKAMTEDPWSWEAFTGLCDMGYHPDPSSLFPDPVRPALSQTSSRTSRPPTLSPNPMPRSSASEMPGFMSRKHSPLMGAPASKNGNGANGGFFTPDVGNGGGRLGMMGNPVSWDTPSIIADTTFPTITEPQLPSPRRPFPNLISHFIPSIRSTPQNPVNEPSKPPAMKRPRGGNGLKKTTEANPYGMGKELRPNGRDLKSVELNGSKGEAPVRRSSRLSSNTTKPTSRATREQRQTRSRSATSSASGQTTDMPSPASHENQLQAVADEWLRDIVRRCARAYRALSLYSCQEALNEVDGLPVEVQRSAWALDIVARCFYEMANYVLSRRAFKALLDLEPYRLESTETYSTVLWHLSDAPSLSFLSQTLISINRESPQPWIAAGNGFSLQKNHDEAMRCFKRATQIDPGCAYAWTLCGYEAIEMEEYERAIAFYRTAIRNDSRHYNAWYGMGVVYLKSGRNKYAEHHFRRAAEINPTNAVLLCCIGTVLQEDDDLAQALAFYEQACKYLPDSPMVQFKRIRVLVSFNRLSEAIDALEPLSRDSPDEAQIFFLLGKCYLRTGRNREATIAFTTARELQPKLAASIKTSIENLGWDREEDEE
ncbi:anaphase-promoting complex subunit 3, partial [Tremellales sp. Uapishka_1]